MISGAEEAAGDVILSKKMYCETRDDSKSIHSASSAFSSPVPMHSPSSTHLHRALGNRSLQDSPASPSALHLQDLIP